MSAYRKNIMVGVAVLVSLVMLGWMILKFGGNAATIFVPPQDPIQIVTERADGISEGSAVQFRGVNVGRVSKVRRSDDNSQVLIDAMVEQTPPLPGNVVASIRSVGLIGSGATIVLTETGAMNGKLKPNQKIVGKWIGLDVLPPEFAELARDLRQTSQQFRESNLIKHMDEAVQHATATIESVQQLVSDEKTRGDLKQAIANIRQATETANRVGANLEKFSVSLNDMTRDANTTIKQVQQNVDKLSNQVNDRIGQVGKLLDSFQSIAKKMDEGKGTAGLLINDPKLYESLVDTSRELNGAIRDLQRLLQQWEQEGPSIRLH